MDSEKIVGSTTDPAFAVDESGTILAWNRAATAMLGIKGSAAVGHPCWKVLGGRDLFGNVYCYPGCPLLAMARRREAVGHSELLFLAGNGHRIRVGVNTVIVPGDGPSHLTVVHLLSRGSGTAEEIPPIALRNCLGEARKRLTDRETEILHLLAAGEGTAEIARVLFITTSTTRNHIQHILRKLKAHSRLEAVSIARRLGLIDGNGA